MEKINKDLIESVSIRRKVKCKQFKITQPSGIKSFWKRKFLKQRLEDVVVDEWWTDVYSKDYFLHKYNDYFIEDNVIYYYPHIIITRSSGKSHTKFFKDVVEMDKWIGDNISDVNLIEI